MFPLDHSAFINFKYFTFQRKWYFCPLHILTSETHQDSSCFEQTSVHIIDTGLTNRALMGHSFKNFTVSKPFDCYEKCFHERCRCQAFQIKGERSCELLDEDRLSAPDEFQEEERYEYFDLNREYKKPVRNIINASIIL